jgi:CheY-like chemotaxis protein
MASILIVDDNIELLSLYEKILSLKCGYTIAGMATDGEKAVSLYKEQLLMPDLVIMDINMERMSGINAALEILDYDPGANIMFATAESISQEDLPQALSHCTILRKPFTLSEFIYSVKSSLKRKVVRAKAFA